MQRCAKSAPVDKKSSVRAMGSMVGTVDKNSPSTSRSMTQIQFSYLQSRVD